MKSLKKNIIYNIIYQILILFVPLITAPYLSRVIGAEGVGIYSYVYSIVYYFMLLTLLGINNYGNRTISKLRDDKKKMSKAFWEIYSFQIFMGIVMLVIYFLLVILLNSNYKVIFIIQSIFIISSILDINWYFFGIEEFKITITKNIIIKILTLIFILIFVKKPSDLWKYTFIMASMACLSQIILFINLKGRVINIKINIKNVTKHIKPIIILFIPIIAISIYKIMDKIMIGIFSKITEVAFYENAEKITNIPVTLVIALGTVMLPRSSNLVSKGNYKLLNEYLEKAIFWVLFISLPMCFGLIAIGKTFAPLFYGIKFSKTGTLITLLAVLIPFQSIANVIRTQYLIPFEKDKVYIKSVIIGAIINFIVNIILINKYGSIGACIGTIISEIIVMLYQVIAIKNEIPIKEYISKGYNCLIKSLIMFVFVYLVTKLFEPSWYLLILQIIIGVSVYGILNSKLIIKMVKTKKYGNI